MVRLMNTRLSFQTKVLDKENNIDFFDTHSPIIRIISIRVLVPLAVVHNSIVLQMDVKVAFFMVNQKKKSILNRFLPQTGSSHVPLALPRRVPLKCNIKLQVAQTHSKRLLNAQRQLQETSMLNHKRKRLLCSITKERYFCSQSQKKETSLNN